MFNVAKAQNPRYHLTHARLEYATEGRSVLGTWEGSGPPTLGLKEGETVHDAPYLDLFARRWKGEQLCQAHSRAVGALDMVVSLPPSVATARAVAAPEIRALFDEAHLAADRRFIAYLERHYATCRKGKGGKESVRAKMCLARYMHETARPEPGQPFYAASPHSHLYLFAAAICADGKWRSLDLRRIFDDQKKLGAVWRGFYREELERRLGLECEPYLQWSFGIKGVSKELEERITGHRTRTIEAEIKARGVENDAAKKKEVTLDTRHKKLPLPPRDELFAHWRKVGEKVGFGAAEVEALCRRRGMEAQRQTKEPECLAAEHLELATKRVAEARKVVEQLPLHRQEEPAPRPRPIAPPPHQALQPRLSYRERKTLEGLSQVGRVVHVPGDEGDKLGYLKSYKRFAESQGYQCVVATLRRAAADNLTEHGIETKTLRQLVFGIKPELRREFFFGKRFDSIKGFLKFAEAVKRPKVRLNRRSVLILDGAHRLGEKELRTIVSEVRRSGAQLIILGGDPLGPRKPKPKSFLRDAYERGWFRALWTLLGEAERSRKEQTIPRFTRPEEPPELVRGRGRSM